MKGQLPSDCTFRSISGELKDATEFVRSAFHNMTGCNQDCQVRIALDSNMRFPDYRLEMLFEDEEDGETIIHAQPIAVFSGRNHKGTLSDAGNLSRPWSSAVMSYKQVQRMLGELRGILSPL